MNNFMERWRKAAESRASVRKFDSALDRETFYSLKSFISSNLTAESARLVLLAKNGVLKSIVHPYGKIAGTNCFAAVIADKNSRYMAGYLGEAFTLECTARGFATCWLGASYNKPAVCKYIKLEPNETVCCIIAVGLKETPVRPARKKTVEQLTGFSGDLFGRLPAWQQAAAKCAALSPSALNKQPWELIIEDDSIGIIGTAYNFGFSEIDRGIAMLHIELGAASCGFYGEWRFDGEIPQFCETEENGANGYTFIEDTGFGGIGAANENLRKP